MHIGMTATVVLALALFAPRAVAQETTQTIAVPGGAWLLGSQLESIGLTGVRANGIDQEREWLGSGAVPLWTVVMQDAQGNRQSLTNLDAATSEIQKTDSGLRVVWTHSVPARISVTVEATPRGDDLLATLRVNLEGDEYSIWDVTFPELGPLVVSNETYSIAPYGWGVIYPDFENHPARDSTYPSAAWAMPFVAVSDDETGIYIGIEDNPGYPLRFFAGQRENAPEASFGLRHEVENMGQAKRFETPYKIVMTLYRGGWYEAGRIYRRTSSSSPWAAVPSLTDRRDLAPWLVNTDLWYIGSCHDEETANQILAFAKFFEAPTAAHVYTWHEIPFDDHYPEYFPAKPGFRDAVAKVQAAGIAVMPYINGRLWDPATDSWRDKDAQSAAALGEDGKRYEEVYGSGVPLSPMCPSTPLWQETVTNLVDRLFNEIGVQAVYIDQISAAAAKRCFAGNHGHPKGGGQYWIQGYREMLRKARAITPAGGVLTTEENADPWNDMLDAFLMVNTRAGDGEIVPLYPVVYAGRVPYFGFQYFGGPDFEYRYPLRLKLAKTFLYGSQMGWIGSQILAEPYATEAAFLKALVQQRHTARDALQFGELLAPVEIADAGVVQWDEATDEGNRTMTHGAVVATMWRTPDGTHKLAIVNVADDARTVQLKLDSRHLPPGAAYRLADDDYVCDLKQTDGRFIGALDLPPLTVMVLGCQVIDPA